MKSSSLHILQPLWTLLCEKWPTLVRGTVSHVLLSLSWLLTTKAQIQGGFDPFLNGQKQPGFNSVSDLGFSPSAGPQLGRGKAMYQKQHFKCVML